ncbi:hypothetical protein CXB51_008268 [Gossypium anomalum]|uniref:Uncharacterized protein n=1 Tax=Gossypium anomalum TaxID=47600 RepID=A0A8J5YWI3_9ROSI|nr:hypothetical protein CXB51_008268 [Gossypium anomalum]
MFFSYVAFHLKCVKKSTLIDEMRKTLCEYKNEHLFSKIKNSKKAQISQISQIRECIQKSFCRKSVVMQISNLTSQLERFKARHDIKSYRRFGESDSIVMENIEDVLPQIRAKLENFDWKDIYNTDEKDLFYRLQTDHSLDTKQLEGRKKNDKERLTVVSHFYSSILKGYEKGEINPEKINHCKIQSKEDMPLEQEIGDVQGIHKLKEVSDLHYINAMKVEQILNYPSENEYLMEPSTDEEIIQGIMDVPADDEQDPEDSSVLQRVSLKEAFLAVDNLKNYLIQHEKNITDLVYTLLNVKDEIVFNSHGKKKYLTIDAYFSKE